MVHEGSVFMVCSSNLNHFSLQFKLGGVDGSPDPLAFQQAQVERLESCSWEKQELLLKGEEQELGDIVL